MDTDPQLGARRQAEGCFDLRRLGILTWQPAREHVLGPRSRARLRRPFYIDRCTAYHRRVARQQVDCADPPRIRGARCDRELLRLLHLVRCDREFRELQLQVRLAHGPLVLERDRRRRTRRIARRAAPDRPREDDVDLARGKEVRVLELAEASVRVPGRHVGSDQFGADRLGPRKRVLVIHQRHRGDAALDVAAPALVPEDRKHVLVEGVLRRDRFVRLTAPARD